MVDRHYLIRPDVDGPSKIRPHEPQRAFDALIYIEKGTRLLAISPHFDLLAGKGHRNLATNSSGRFLATAPPRPFRPEDIVITCDIGLPPEVPAIGEI